MVRPVSTYVAVLLLMCSTANARADGEGQGDLDQAVELQLTATTPADLTKIVEFCESAIRKGLDEASAGLAKQLLSSAALQQSERLAEAIFDPQQRDRNRWPAIRRDAMKLLEKAVANSPQLGDAHLLIARLQALPNGDAKQALEAATAAVEAFKASGDKPKLAASLLLRSNFHEDQEKAIADLEAAVEADPDNEIAWRAQAASYLGRGDLAKAVESFRKILDRDADNLIARLALAETLSDMRNFDEAIQEIETVLKAEENSSPAHMLKGRILAAQDKFEESELALTKAIALDPRNLPALLLRGEVRLIQDKLLEAREDAERVLSTQPNLILGIMLRSRISAMEQKYDAAIADIEILLENDPQNTDFKMQLALYHSLADRPRMAVKLFGEVLEQDEENWRALRSRGDAYLSYGEHKLAVADYRRALEIKQDESGLLNNLAWVLSTSPDDDVRQGQEALELALKACELTKYEAAHVLSTLASCYAEIGDFDKALKWSAKAVELSEETDENHEQLKQEHESYKEKKPWRERQETKEKEDPKKRALLET